MNSASQPSRSEPDGATVEAPVQPSALPSVTTQGAGTSEPTAMAESIPSNEVPAASPYDSKPHDVRPDRSHWLPWLLLVAVLGAAALWLLDRRGHGVTQPSNLQGAEQPAAAPVSPAREP